MSPYMQIPASKSKHFMPIWGLYLLTPDNWSAARLNKVLEPLLAAGIAMLQYRDKSCSASQRLIKAQMLSALCSQYHTPLIINDDIALARQVAADGVHLGRTDASPQQARQQLGAQAIIGCTCYNDLRRARQMRELGADYLAFGSLFASPTKPAAPRCSPATLTQAQSFGLPVVAIGGINLDNAALVIQAGANLLALISDVFDAADPLARVQRYQLLFEQHRQSLQQQEQA
ncbi:MAG: thiamine phosphate synthase [Gammaproteobacteria bacterium]|jgi:thiamine-phosphate pyrophosphorylase|nr:thiamine phosphate synthase [Gammaproteobacteria bacterium]